MLRCLPFALKTLLVGMLLFPIGAVAQDDYFPWTILFHLKEQGDTLMIDSGSRFASEPIPGEYGVSTKAVSPEIGKYYGEYQDPSGKNILRFGVEVPDTIVAGKDYTIVEVWAPMRGDAAKAVFFTRDGRRLFEISTKDSMRCNNNTVCDGGYGENEYNCPLECPPTVKNEDVEPPYIPPTTDPELPPTTTPTPHDPAPVVSSPTPTQTPSPVMNPLIIYGGFALLGLLIAGFVIRAFLKYKKGVSELTQEIDNNRPA